MSDGRNNTSGGSSGGGSRGAGGAGGTANQGFGRWWFTHGKQTGTFRRWRWRFLVGANGSSWRCQMVEMV